MCQMNVILMRNNHPETIMEEVSRLEVRDNEIVLSTLFNETKTVHEATIKDIDFVKNIVTLATFED